MLIDAALSWLDRGFAVFPLKPRGKVPLGSLAPQGFLDATRDPAVIRDWWQRAPKANLGLRTGEGKFVLDLDGAEAISWFANAGGRHGGAPKTLTTRTARGFHVFFSCDVEVPCSTARLAPGADIKGQGGYVVAAPSVHPSGHVYSFARDLPIAEAPRWLVDLAMPDPDPMPVIVARGEPWHHEAKLRAVPGILSLVANAREGERNRILFWAACRFRELVRRGSIPDHAARDLLVEAGRRCGLHGMEIIHTVHSAYRRAGHG